MDIVVGGEKNSLAWQLHQVQLVIWILIVASTKYIITSRRKSVHAAKWEQKSKHSTQILEVMQHRALQALYNQSCSPIFRIDGLAANCGCSSSSFPRLVPGVSWRSYSAEHCKHYIINHVPLFLELMVKPKYVGVVCRLFLLWFLELSYAYNWGFESSWASEAAIHGIILLFLSPISLRVYVCL